MKLVFSYDVTPSIVTDNEKAYQTGAVWQIAYSYHYDSACQCSYWVLDKAKFTGRVLSENRQSLQTSGSKSGQKQFKIFSECICSCTAKSISFLYGDDYSKDLRIDVSLGGCGNDPSVGFQKDKSAKNYIYYRKPIERFIDEKSKLNVNATLKKILLDVYNLAEHCEASDATSGTFTETKRFSVLTKLRQQSKLTVRPTIQWTCR